jgi:hypothetical protein
MQIGDPPTLLGLDDPDGVLRMISEAQIFQMRESGHPLSAPVKEKRRRFSLRRSSV